MTDTILWILGSICAVVLMALLVTATVQEDERFMQECMADGRKQYECRAMNKPNIIYMVK